MKSQLFTILITLISPVIVLGMNCQFPDDQARGIQVNRARLSVQGTSACLIFLSYKTGSAQVSGRSCGTYNPKYGIRNGEYGFKTMRFDGFANFSQQSGYPIPTEKTPYAIIEIENQTPRVQIKRDRRMLSDLEYICHE